MALRINYDLEKDAWNLWNTVNDRSLNMDFSKFIIPELVRTLRGKTRKKGIKIAKSKIIVPNKGLMDAYISAVSKAWREIEGEYFKRIERIMKKPMYRKSFNADVTTIPRCPYHMPNNWFMLPFFASITTSLRIAGHEIMHFQFLYFYEDALRKGLNNEEINHLKESLTVLLNLEFRDLWIVNDPGYPKHQKLRKYIAKKWSENPDFDELLEKSVKYIKRGNYLN